MRIRELRKHLEGCKGTDEVYVRINLDFLDGHPDLLVGFDVVWGEHCALELITSVRLGDLAFKEHSQETMDEPCCGCPLDKASDWLFEHVTIDELIDGFCDRPLNCHRCCFWPEPPSDDDRSSEGACDMNEDECPF